LADVTRRRRDHGSAPLTLGPALAAKVWLIVWCGGCGHQTEPDVAVLVAHNGATMTVIDWAARLTCSRCGARDADFVVTGTRR
jgi:hypothetical protein